MPLDLGRYGSRNVLDCKVLTYDSGNLTGALKWFMDYANAATNEWTSDVTYATGGDGAPRRISWQSNKQGTLTLSTQIYSLQQLAHFTGGSITSAATNIFRRDVKTVVDNLGSLEITLDKTAIDTNGDATVDGSDVLVYKIVNGIEDTANPVTVSSVSGTTVVLTGVTAGDEVSAFYQWTTTNPAHKITFTADNFPDYCTIVGDTLFADEVSGTMVDAQLIYYKAKLNPNFTFNWSNSGDPTTLELQFDLFAVDKSGVSTMADIVLYAD